MPKELGAIVRGDNLDVTQVDEIDSKTSTVASQEALAIPTPTINGTGLGVSLYSNPDWVSNRNQELLSIREDEEAKGYWDGLGIAMENEWFSYAIGRNIERSGREVDPNWKISDDQLSNVTLSYSDNEQKYLLESQSQSEYAARKKDIEEDRVRNAKVAEYGLLPTLTMAVLDPVGILLGVATGGVGIAAKTSRLTNAMRLGGLTAAETATLEYALLQGDTQKDMQDVFLAGAMGFGIGGALGSLSRVAKTQAQLDADARYSDKVREIANQAKYTKERDDLLARQYEKGDFKQVLDKVQVKVLDLAHSATGRLLSQPRVDGLTSIIEKGKDAVSSLRRAKESAIAEELSLQSVKGEGSILDRTAKKSITKSIEGARTSRGKLLSDKQDELSKFWAKAGAPKTGVLDAVTRDQADRIAKKWDDQIKEFDDLIEDGNYKLNASDRAKASKNSRTKKNIVREQEKRQTAVDKISKDYDNRIDSLLSRLDGYQERLDNNNALIGNKAELERVKKLSKEEQANEFYPEHSPELLAEISSISSRLDELYKLGIKENDDLLNKYIKPEGELTDDSVGAMRARGTGSLFPDEVLGDTDKAVVDAMIERYLAYENIKGRNWTGGLPDWLLSDYTKANKSESLELLALNHLLRDNPQVGDTHTAATLVKLNDNKLRYAGRNAMDSGFELYLTENGIGAVSGYLRSSNRIKYEEQVALAIKGIGDESLLPPSILRARDGMRNLFKEAGAMRKKYKERGFEELEQNPNYLPDIMDSNSVHNLKELRWNKEDIIGLLKNGYYRGNNKLTEKQAEVVAEIKYNSISKGWLATDDVANVFRADNIADATRLLKQAKVPQNLIDDFFEDIFTESDFKTISKRARKTLNINWEADHTAHGSTVKISDIMTTNVSKLSEAYTIESAFGAAMAELGIKSEGQLARILDNVQKSSMALGGDSGKKAKQHMEDIYKTLTQLRGRPIVDYSSKFNKAGRMVLDTTAMLRLQQVGFASVPEFARSITELGFFETMRNITSSGMFRMPSFKFGEVRGRDNAMRLYNEEMQDVEEMIGFIGEPEFGRNFNVREEDLGSEASGRFVGLLDRALEGGRRVGSVLSLHKMIQGGLGKVVANGTNRALLKGALGTRTMSKSMRNQLRMTGMKDERWEEISQWVRGNPRTIKFEGRDIDVWNHDAMPEDIRRDIQVTLNRLLDRSVQKANVGELNASWLGAFGRYLTQFRTFSLISLEKQLVADVRGDASSMPSKFMYGLGLASASYYAQMNLRALALPDDKREEYLDKNLTGANLYWGVFNKHSMLAAAGIFNDAGIASGMLPKEAYDSTRYGYLNSNVDAVVPSLGLINDTLAVTGSTAGVVGAAYRDESVSDASKQLAHDLIKVTPYAQTIGFSEYIKNITED